LGFKSITQRMNSISHRPTLDTGRALPAAAANDRARKLMLLATACMILWLPALAIDLPLARLVRDGRLPSEIDKLLSLSEIFAHGAGVILILSAVAVLDPRGWRVIPRLLGCSLGAGLVADVTKFLVARWRPKSAPLDGSVWDTFLTALPTWHRDALPQAWDRALQSFPSGHTATAVGLAIGLTILYPRGRWLFATLALLATLQRIASQAHFLSDTLAAAALAALVALLYFAPSPIGRFFDRLEFSLPPRIA
jgi:membrane-associated phospholipid phosphatase